jgi:hypothetical protein
MLAVVAEGPAEAIDIALCLRLRPEPISFLASTSANSQHLNQLLNLPKDVQNEPSKDAKQPVLNGVREITLFRVILLMYSKLSIYCDGVSCTPA